MCGPVFPQLPQYHHLSNYHDHHPASTSFIASCTMETNILKSQCLQDMGFVSFSYYTCPLCVNWGLCFMPLSLQHLTCQADLTWNTANSRAGRKVSSGKLFTGSSNFCLEITHVISAHISLTKVNPMAVPNYKGHTSPSPTVSGSWKCWVKSTKN